MIQRIVSNNYHTASSHFQASSVNNEVIREVNDAFKNDYAQKNKLETEMERNAMYATQPLN